MNATFTRATEYTPTAIPSSLILFRNSMRQALGTDYKRSTDTKPFIPAAVPQVGDFMVADLRDWSDHQLGHGKQSLWHVPNAGTARNN